MLGQHLSEKLFILARHRGSLVQLFPAITKTGIQAAQVVQKRAGAQRKNPMHCDARQQKLQP